MRKIRTQGRMAHSSQKKVAHCTFLLMRQNRNRKRGIPNVLNKKNRQQIVVLINKKKETKTP